MYESYFTSANSMHDFMLRLFLTETGLTGCGPTHQQVQYDALCSITSGIKNKLTALSWNEDEAFLMNSFSSIRISREADAKLFLKVLKKVKELNDLMLEPEDIIQLAVYPFFKPMIESNSQLKEVLNQHYTILIEKNPTKDGLITDSPLALRLRNTIEKSFGMTNFFKDEKSKIKKPKY